MPQAIIFRNLSRRKRTKQIEQRKVPHPICKKIRIHREATALNMTLAYKKKKGLYSRLKANSALSMDKSWNGFVEFGQYGALGAILRHSRVSLPPPPDGRGPL